MKIVAAVLMLALLLTPGVALAGSDDAALALGAFAVFNQIISGTGIFAGAPVVVAPRPVYVAPQPVYAPPPVYVAPPPVVVAPRPVFVYRTHEYYRGGHGHWKHRAGRDWGRGGHRR
jgi:hypothetical protein